MPIWLMLAIVALFTVASAFPAIDTECALVALGLTVGTFTVRVIIRRPR
jgi:hypothetical protein